MIIGPSHVWILRCDFCQYEVGPGSDPQTEDYRTKTELKKGYREYGWRFHRDGRVRCSDCKEAKP